MRRSLARTTENRQSPQQPDRAERENARPFDSRELQRLPPATDDDPPCQPWWVVDRA